MQLEGLCYGCRQAHESMKDDKTYSSMAAVPGNMGELLEVEEERFTAAALFGLSSSDSGIKTILQIDDASALDGEHCQSCGHMWPFV